jgi:NAD(P)-dependent dehydrogenase (short-subunit alcohol dehydrogenase family)
MRSAKIVFDTIEETRMPLFSDRTVLITGAGRGLGRQLALDFGLESANVVVNYSSSEEAAHEVVARITAAGGHAITCRADIANPEDVNAMVETAKATYGVIDILINNAGLSLDAPFLEISEEAWDRVMDVNLKGPFLLSQAVGRHMVGAGHGRIINISATSAIHARIGNANYAASKGGLHLLTQSMALELGPNVTVNTVALGFVDSPLVRELFTEEQLTHAADSVPLKRMTTYEETSQFVMMLASDAAGFMTGQTIPFDGGRVMR